MNRRTFLASLGSAGLAAAAGCGTSLGTSGPRSLATPEPIQDSPTALAWEFPKGASDEDTPIQTYLQQDARVPADRESVPVRFAFGATVFEHAPYRHDAITLKVRAPADYQAARPPADIFVQPPSGGFSDFRIDRADRRTVVALRDLETIGTLQFAFIVDSGARPTPETLRYDFEVRAANPDLLGRDVVAADHGTVDIVRQPE